ncbi:MAG: FAD-binding oxidoreductase [Deltaproteobacteria bacterium]
MKPDLLKRLAEICGSDYLLHSSEAIELYSRCTIPWSRKCGAIALPENVDQVSRIVRLFSELKIPVWPFSGGRNWGYGTVLALQEGALILILERMNRICEINEELCYAVIEPGVSQGQLNAYLKSSGSRLWIDCTDSSPDCSLIGNALDKGVGYTPYGDHFGHLCGMEVVLANGEVITTGGIPEQCPTRYTYKWGVGPFVDGLFAQSSLGVVTKAGLWLMPEPEAFQAFVLEISHAELLAPAIDAHRELGLQRIVGNCHAFNEFMALARTFGYPDHLLKGKQCLSEQDIEEWALHEGLAPWTFIGGVYGTRRQVKANRSEIRKRLSPLGRLTFMGMTSERFLTALVRGVHRDGITGVFYQGLQSLLHLVGSKVSPDILESLVSLYPALRGEPDERFLGTAYFKNKERQPSSNLNPARDGCGLMWFAPILPARGREIQVFVEQVKRICLEDTFETAAALIQLNPRTFVVLVPLLFSRTNAEEAERAERTYDRLCGLLDLHEYRPYRCPTPYMETILGANPGYQQLMKRVKEALDPHRVIAPGRYGV